MALQPQQKEIEIKHNKKLDDVKINTNISLTTNGEKIEKVLFVKSFCCINNTNITKSSVLIDGTINSYALIKLENGEIITLTKATNFSTTYNSNLIDLGNKIFIVKKSCSVENLSVNEISLSFSTQIVLSLYLIKAQNIKYVESILPANQKTGVVEYSTITNVLDEKFETINEIDLPSSVSKILLVESNVFLKDAICSKDIITLSGEIYNNVIFLTNDEIPKLKNQIYTTDFRQEILSNGAVEGQNIQASLSICQTEFSVDGEISSLKGVLELKNTIEASILVRKNEEIEIVLDAFCPRKEMQMEYSSFQSQKIVSLKSVSEKVDGNIVLEDDGVRIDKVLISSNGEVVVSSYEIEEENLLLKGVVNCYIVYQFDDENKTIQSMQMQIPFQTNVLIDDLTKDDEIFITVNIKDIEARPKRAKEIEVLCELNISIQTNRTEENGIISNIIVGENRTFDMPNMGIYVVNNITDCWEISKTLLINPEVLMKQNPTLNFPITKPTQVIVYRQKNEII